MNTTHPQENRQSPAGEDSRGIRFVAFILPAFAINTFWLWHEISSVVEPGYAECWYILLLTLISTVPTYAAGFALSMALGRWLKPALLAGLLLAMLITACGLHWPIVIPGLVWGALAGIVEQKLRALALLLLAGCAAVYTVNAACILVGSLRARNKMQPVQVGSECWRGHRVEGPIPFFISQEILLLQKNDGDIHVLYGGHRSTTPEYAKDGPDWVEDVQAGRYHRLFDSGPNTVDGEHSTES